MRTAAKGTLVLAAVLAGCATPATGPPLRIGWDKHILSIHGDHLPGGVLETWYLEAYCRPGARDQPWDRTTVGHETKLVEASPDGQRLKLRCTVADGVVVDHEIFVEPGGVAFRLQAHNPTDKVSMAHWAQPCIRVGGFTGTGPDKTDDKYAYIKKSFVYLDGKPTFMPTRDWALTAQYTPGQVWVPRAVPRADANPRPHHPDPPDNGLIGCVSADGHWILATAWEPYQELFQGVIRCLHSDFRIGGLEPGQTKTIRGKIYIVPKDFEALLARYRKDFPEQVSAGK